MGDKAVAPFSIEGWEEDVYDERPGARLSRTRITKTFTGDFTGTSEAETLTCGAAVEGPRRTWASSGSSAACTAGQAPSCCTTPRPAPAGSAAAPGRSCPTPAPASSRGISGAGEIVVAEDGAHTLMLAYELG